jgi:hypothetical protein
MPPIARVHLPMTAHIVFEPVEEFARGIGQLQGEIGFVGGRIGRSRP